MSEFSPIALFVFRRPVHTLRTVESLLKCPETNLSPIYIFADGPRDESQRAAVMQTRELLTEHFGDRAIYFFSKDNKGLSKSILSGVDYVLKIHGSVIVLEDDLVFNSGFLKFMNEAINKYRYSENVFQVSGHAYSIPGGWGKDKSLEAKFFPLTNSWGWATWSRAWESFDVNALGWEELKKNKKLRREFNLSGYYDYSTMLERQMSGKSDSWAIRWYWTVFRARGLVVYPPVTLVHNSGQDGSGTHGRGITNVGGTSKWIDAAVDSISLPEDVVFSREDFNLFLDRLWKINGGYFGWLVGGLKRLIGK